MKKYRTLLLIDLFLSISFGVFAKQKVVPSASLLKHCRGNIECISDVKEANTICEGSTCTEQF